MRDSQGISNAATKQLRISEYYFSDPNKNPSSENRFSILDCDDDNESTEKPRQKHRQFMYRELSICRP